MNDAKKIELLAELFEVDEAEITPEKELSELHWDSLNMLGLIALFKAEMNIRLSPEKLRSFKTINDILQEMK